MKNGPQNISMTLTISRKRGENWRDCLIRLCEKLPSDEPGGSQMYLELFDEFIRDGTPPHKSALCAIGMDLRVVDWKWN